MKVDWSRNAKRELAEIVNYIAARSPRSAARIDDLMAKAAAGLRQLPLTGRRGAIPDTREILPHPSYRLVYQVSGETVSILSVVHTARQWPPASGDR